MRILKYNKIAGVVILMAVASLSFSSGESRWFSMSKNMEIFSNLYKELNQSYVDEIEAAQLMRKGLDAMLKSLDPYTNYISEAQIETARLERSGKLGDVGVAIILQDDKLFVKEVKQGMGADEVGMQAGDEIVEIDRKPVKGRTAEDAILALKGQPDSEVEIVFKSFETGKQVTKVVKRTKVEKQKVVFHQMLNDEVGYIKLTTFMQRGCSNQVAGAFNELKENEDFKYLIFDLRDNGGGLLNEAVAIANIFLPKEKEVVSTKGKLEEWNKSYVTQAEPLTTDVPVAVLINGKSASASEIVSGVLQDYDRGVLIGQRSYGKGLVQQTRDIGFNSKLKVTVAKYYLPSGRCIQAVDYTGDYTDDGAKEIPEEHRKAFKTTNGRVVYDNGGVKPDMSIDKMELTPFLKSLNDRHEIFHFVNDYVKRTESVAEPTEFEVDENLLNQFSQHLDQKKFVYDSDLQKGIDKLLASAEEDEHSATVLAMIEDLKTKATLNNTRMVQDNSQILKLWLRNEVLTRYYYEEGKIKASLDDDRFIAKAKEVFADQESYAKILNAGS